MKLEMEETEREDDGQENAKREQEVPQKEEKWKEYEHLIDEDYNKFASKRNYPYYCTKEPIHGNDGKSNAGPWTKEEHERFLTAIRMFGNEWKKVCDYVGTRNAAQIRSHCQKHFLRVKRDELQKALLLPPSERKIFIVTREYLNHGKVIKNEIEIPECHLQENIKANKKVKEELKDEPKTPEVLNIPAPGAVYPLYLPTEMPIPNLQAIEGSFQVQYLPKQ